MEVQFSRQMEARIDQAAARNRCGGDEYFRQLIERYADHDLWFGQKVRKALHQLDRGEYITHEEIEEMGERIELMFRS